MNKFLKIIKEDEELDRRDCYFHTITNQAEELLGYIIFFEQWKQWVYTTEDCYDDIYLSEECLQQIIDYLKDLNKGESKCPTK